MKKLGLSVLACLCLLGSQPARAWHQGGHELVAQIAWDRLRPRDRVKLDAILSKLPDPRYRQFVIASIWPDVIKSRKYLVGGEGGSPYPADRIHGNWHFKDVPIFMGEVPHAVVDKSESILDGLPKEVAVLSDAKSDPADRAVALSWVLHLVGDVHQPLHCASLYSPAFEPDPDGDKGGNAFVIHGSKATELHAFWDSVAESFPLDINNPPTMSRIQADAAHLEREFPERHFDDEARDLDLADWVHQSSELARTVAYTLPYGGTPDAAYRARALAVCHERIALAGYRLAHLLERCLRS